MYFFIRDMIIDIAGQEGLRYFPYIFTLFILILFVPLKAITIQFHLYKPYCHNRVSCTLCFITVTVIGFIMNGFGFLSLLVSSAPLALRPILLIIEVISIL